MTLFKSNNLPDSRKVIIPIGVKSPTLIEVECSIAAVGLFKVIVFSLTSAVISCLGFGCLLDNQ